MLKIVAMFKQKEVFGAVEPIVPGCAPMRAAVMTGALIGITIKPSQPGTRCGNHYVLSVMEGVRKGKTIKVYVYDLTKVPYDRLESMVGKPVEAETLGGSAVTAIRLAGQPGNAQTVLAPACPPSNRADMSSNEWTPLPSLWPEPAASRTVGKHELLVFTQVGVPTWEVRYHARRAPAQSVDLLASGTADSFNAAKAAALHEASMLTMAKPAR